MVSVFRSCFENPITNVSSLRIYVSFLNPQQRTCFSLPTGPIASIMFNAGEVSRALACSAELAQNQTMAHLELRLKPLHDIMVDLKVE